MKPRFTEQGMALLAVVAVLIALVLIATPFAIQMQSAARRAEMLLYTEQAAQDADSLISLANLYLIGGTDAVEAENAANKAQAFATPDFDTLDEIQLPLDLLEEFNRNSATGLIWDVRVEDEQAKININSAPYSLLGNLFGASFLAEDVEEGAGTILLEDPSVFPEKDGLVRIGTELVRYSERRGNALVGLTRGVDSDRPWNSQGRGWGKGTLVTDAVAFEIATYPIRIREGQMTPYQNAYQVKRIAELGSVALDPEVLDSTLGMLTCYSGREVAGGWSNTQKLRSALPSGSSDTGGDSFVVDNPMYFGRGTLVRITDGTNTDYAMVVDVRGREVHLGSTVQHDFQADRARVQTYARHPVNLNTASDEVLIACMENVGLRLRVRDSVTREEAVKLIERFREDPVRSLYHYHDILKTAANDGLISTPDYYALYFNSLNPQDRRLAFSTVPFCFKSYDTYTVKATAVVNSKTGEEVARKSVRRVVSVHPRKSTVWTLNSQDDFEMQIIASRDAPYFMSFPYNTGGTWEGKNNPPSRFAAHVHRGIWPSYSNERGIGDMRLQPERVHLNNVYHFDESPHSDGHYINEGPLSYSTRNRQVGMAEDKGLKPFALSFWYKPFWGGLSNTQYLMDTGEDTYTNRVGIFFDADKQELVLRVADATLEQRAAEVRYKVDADKFIDETWYHVTANCAGTKPEDLSLLVDFRAIGEASYLTRLTSGISATGDISEISVENAETFPESGALIVRGEYGAEIIEYDSRSDSTFSVRKRFARIPSWIVEGDEFEGRAHEAGAPVELLGYANPLVTDIPLGGATLPGDLSMFHAMKVVFDEDVLYIPAEEGGGGGGGGGGAVGGIGGQPPHVFDIQEVLPPAGGESGAPPGGEIRGIGKDRTTVDLRLGTGITAWNEGMADDEALRAFGNRGFALIVSSGPFSNLVPGEVIGGWEIVTYQKSGGGLTIERYKNTKQISEASPHFVPQHTYGNPDAPVLVDGEGIPTAIIPISIDTTGNSDYFDVVDNQELQHQDVNITRAYAQIGTEWFAYTYPDQQTSGSGTLLVFDRPSDIQSVVALFGGGNVSIRGQDGGGVVSPPEDPDDPGGPPDDDDPPSPEPPGPPPPEPGGGGDGGPGGGPTPEPDIPGPPDNDGGPTGGDTPGSEPPPPPPRDDSDDGPSGGPTPGSELPPPPPRDDSDDGPSGGTTPPPPEPPIPPENDGGPSGDPTPEPGGGGGGEEPPPSTGGGGEEPPDAEEPPDEDGPEIAGGSQPGGGFAGNDVPFTEEEIASRLRHRPSGQYRVADTYAGDHTAGDQVFPGFVVGANRDEISGYDDLVTVATDEGPQELLRIQHGYLESNGEHWLNWVALTSFASTRYEHAHDRVSSLFGGLEEERDIPRLLKFPSGELPDAVGEKVWFGSRFDGSGLSSAYIDELFFRESVNLKGYFLGDGSVLQSAGGDQIAAETMDSVDESQDQIHIFMWPTASNEDGLPITGLPEDGGILRINDEIIVYKELDPASGRLSGVIRGSLQSEAESHPFQARVTEIDGATMAVLDGSVGTTAFEIPLNRIDGFPREGGYVLIDDEIIGYTHIEGNRLVMPEDLRPAENTWDMAPPDGEEADTGAGIFRGRYGTEATSHADKSIVWRFPARYPDRYVERSADPAVSAVIIRKRVDQAIWKRVSWDEKLTDFTNVRVLVRFDGTPEWDSDKIYDVNDGMETGGTRADRMADPKSFLYQIDNPHAENRFLQESGIQADFIEVRFMIQYEAGAFQKGKDYVADSWKETPWVKAMRIEFVAPVTVHYGEEVR